MWPLQPWKEALSDVPRCLLVEARNPSAHSLTLTALERVGQLVAELSGRPQPPRGEVDAPALRALLAVSRWNVERVEGGTLREVIEALEALMVQRQIISFNKGEPADDKDWMLVTEALKEQEALREAILQAIKERVAPVEPQPPRAGWRCATVSCSWTTSRFPWK